MQVWPAGQPGLLEDGSQTCIDAQLLMQLAAFGEPSE